MNVPSIDYRYAQCSSDHPHRLMFVGPSEPDDGDQPAPTVRVWLCPFEGLIWTDPMRPECRGFRLTWGFDQPTLAFEWK